MAVTIDKFELLPAAPPPPAPAGSDAAQAQQQGGAPPPPSRHDVLRVLREEHARRARVHAH